MDEIFLKFMIYFIIYSLMGWLIEVLYAYKKQRRFINRGFLIGPMCPIYGCGAIAMISIFQGYKSNILILFLLSTAIISFIEYITGTILEGVFNKKYWDYGDEPFNIKGRVCLHFSLIWGLLVLLVIKYVHPLIDKMLYKTNYNLIQYLGIITFLILVIDFTYSATTQINKKKMQLDIQTASTNHTNNAHNFYEISKAKLLYIFKNKFY